MIARHTLLIGLVTLIAASCEPSLMAAEGRRPPTVVDSIEMTMLGEPREEFRPTMSTAKFAPNRRHFVVITRRGNLRTDVNDYSLLLFASTKVADSSQPEILFTVAARTNSPGIHDVRWLDDNETLLFLGESEDGTQQIFSLNIRSRASKQLTRHPVDIVQFDATRDLAKLVFLAKPLLRPSPIQAVGGHGVVVMERDFSELLSRREVDGAYRSLDLFLSTRGATPERVALSRDVRPSGDISLSPDGRYAGLVTLIAEHDLPAAWTYQEKFTGWINIPTFTVVDLPSGETRQLLEAPAGHGGGAEMAWVSAESVVVNSYLPLQGVDTREREVREKAPFTVEVNVADLSFAKIRAGHCRTESFDRNTGVIVLGPQADLAESISPLPGSECGSSIRGYSKSGKVWKSVEVTSSVNGREPIRVIVEQDMNTPPRLIALRRGTRNKTILLNPNPQFDHLSLAEVQEISFVGRDGVKRLGGLYLPVNLTRGTRYPLVIQTHGWNRHRFAIDGESTAGYAAQALAGKGFVVAQLPEATQVTEREEGEKNMAMYAGLIDNLSERGIVDRKRVGILGWSRTVYHTRYALAFSPELFAAAVVVDGIDGGYLEYLLSSNSDLITGDVTSEILNGSRPFGDGLLNWLRNAPSFNLERVRAPILQFSLGYGSLDSMWESYAGLKRLNKPVEMVWLPASHHWPIRPSERLGVQQGVVDWFCFWLLGERDSSKEKSDQYARWQHFRALLDQHAESMASGASRGH